MCSYFSQLACRQFSSSWKNNYINDISFYTTINCLIFLRFDCRWSSSGTGFLLFARWRAGCPKRDSVCIPLISVHRRCCLVDPDDLLNPSRTSVHLPVHHFCTLHVCDTVVSVGVICYSQLVFYGCWTFSFFLCEPSGCDDLNLLCSSNLMPDVLHVSPMYVLLQLLHSLFSCCLPLYLLDVLAFFCGLGVVWQLMQCHNVSVCAVPDMSLLSHMVSWPCLWTCLWSYYFWSFSSGFAVVLSFSLSSNFLIVPTLLQRLGDVLHLFFSASVTMLLHLSSKVLKTPSFWCSRWCELKFRYWAVCIFFRYIRNLTVSPSFRTISLSKNGSDPSLSSSYVNMMLPVVLRWSVSCCWQPFFTSSITSSKYLFCSLGWHEM